MKYTNIFEKLQCIFDIASKDCYGIIFLVIAFFFLIFILTKIVSKKSGLLVISFSYFALLGITIFKQQKQLGVIGNDIINNFFTNLYFPSVYVYLFIYIVICAVSVYALFSKHMSKVYQWIHGITFFAIQFIFVMILNILAQNEIDVFSKASLFSNKNLVILLECSTNIFIVWIIAILFVYFTNVISEKIMASNSSLSYVRPRELKYSPVNMTTLSTSLDVADVNDDTATSVDASLGSTNPLAKLENVSVITSSNSQSFPAAEVSAFGEVNNDVSFNPVMTSIVQEDKIDFQDFISQKTETIIPNPLDVNHSYNYNLSVSDNETDQYTLNDYRLFSKILKEIKEHNSSNQVIIDKDMEYRLITKYSSETYDMFKKMLESYSH